MIEVVCGIIYKEGKVLICRRALHKTLGGYWEFPGGKIEPGERAEQSLKRELLEELGMEVEIQDYLMEHIHDYGSFSIKLIAYTCEFKNASFVMGDHDAYKWVYPQELEEFELAPADISIAQIL
jgi:8-oxo-dGTP diphosphatase